MMLFKIAVCFSLVVPVILQSLLKHHFAQLLTDNQLDVDTGGFGGEIITGAGICGMLAGCKVLGGRIGCYGPSGGNKCAKCQHTKPVTKRNVMRADFYRLSKKAVKNCLPQKEGCPKIPYMHEMVDYMLLKGDYVARSPQGSMFNTFRGKGMVYNFDVPEIFLTKYQRSKFCGDRCFKLLRFACLQVTLLPHVRQWCLTIHSWLKDDIEKLSGPSSYVLFLAARLVDISDQLQPVDKIECGKYVEEPDWDIASNVALEIKPLRCAWPNGSRVSEFEEKAALVSAAMSSVLLTGRWFDNQHELFGSKFQELGFAVQHSLWLAIYMGRLRITLQPLDKEYQIWNHIVPGGETLCSETDQLVAENYEGVTGTAYASLCAMFKKLEKKKTTFHHPKIRFRPEIHVQHTQGCVERTTGMIFIRPGDWITLDSRRDIIGSYITPLGFIFYNREENLTTLEMTSSKTTMYPPSISVALEHAQSTICTNAKANGPNYAGQFSYAGITGIGGMCNWVPVW